MTTQIPTISFPELWHVGSFCAADKKNWSLEGQGLSVSLHPEEWSRIARLSGATWILTKDHNRFLDYHNLSEASREEIAQWGIVRGYVERQTTFIASWFDDEWDQTMSMFFLNREDALEQADEDEDCVEERVALVATDTFPDHTVQAGYIDPQDMLTVLWAEEQGLDGVWWNDLLDPSRLSAPRGVITVNKVNTWTIKRI